MNPCKGRIKPGTRYFQDFMVCTWPPVGADPDTPFEMSGQPNGGVLCRADGFGFGIPGTPKGAYGNGAVWLLGFRGGLLEQHAEP